jgi:AcrR family transcriptional regulator
VPRPRFHRLPDDARRTLLEAAAREFAARGYDGASLTRIIKAAGISKGALYYYFDDKADLFATVTEQVWHDLLPEKPLDLDALTATTFWPALGAAMSEMTRKGHERPWLVGIGRLMYRPPSSVDAERIAAPFREARAYLARLLGRGRTLGVVRDDLPEELLATVVAAAAEAVDRFMVQHWEELDGAEGKRLERVLFALLQRIAAPPAPGEGT